ncbi:MAG: hypothetical protein M3Q60_19430 [Actinomycetota bacterium]|nr:hypothetical protein [Actinomycetota bacterium]
MRPRGSVGSPRQEEPGRAGVVGVPFVRRSARRRGAITESRMRDPCWPAPEPRIFGARQDVEIKGAV